MTTLPKVQGAWFFFSGKGDVITEQRIYAGYNTVTKYKPSNHDQQKGGMQYEIKG